MLILSPQDTGGRGVRRLGAWRGGKMVERRRDADLNWRTILWTKFLSAFPGTKPAPSRKTSRKIIETFFVVSLGRGCKKFRDNFR